MITEGLRRFAVKTKTSAERDRVVVALRPAPLTFCGLDGLTPLIAAGLVGLHAQPVFKGREGGKRPAEARNDGLVESRGED